MKRRRAGTRETIPDLFERAVDGSVPDAGTVARQGGDRHRDARRYVLPRGLSAALRHLDDDQLDALLRDVMAEARRRGRAPEEPATPPAQDRGPAGRPGRRAAPSSPSGPDIPVAQANLIRAAHQAGLTPAAIARQFGLSPAVVRRVVAAAAKTER